MFGHDVYTVFLCVRRAVRGALAVLSGDSVGRGATDAELLCCLSRRETGLNQFAGLRKRCLGREGWPTRLSTALSSGSNAVAGALGNETPLEMGNGAEDMENQFPRPRTRCLDFSSRLTRWIPRDLRLSTVSSNSRSERPRRSRRVTQSRSPGACVIDELGEARALEGLSGNGVGEYADSARLK